MADGSRNNPADVHRTSRTSLQFHCTPLGTTFHIQYRSIQTKVSNVSHTTTQELLKKARGVCRGAVALRPLCGFPQLPKAKKPGLLPSKKVKIKPKTNHLCGFLTFQCDLPSAGFRSPCGIQQGAAIYAVIRPEFRNLCGHSAGASAAHAVIISPYKI